MTHCMIVAGVDDEHHRLDRLVEMFSIYDFDVTSQDNANQALESCGAMMPDVIVLPENLLDMDVIAFVKQIRRAKNGGQAAVFVCAREADSEKIGQAIWEGASDFLIGSFDAEVLDRKLQQVGVV